MQTGKALVTPELIAEIGGFIEIHLHQEFLTSRKPIKKRFKYVT
jgi:hypothetical protein